MTTPDDVTAYLDRLPAAPREVVDKVRGTVLQVIPEATESISYDIPTFWIDGRRIVHVAGWAKHVSLYPVPPDEALTAELAPYLSGKGTLKFPLSAPVPYELIARVVRALADRS